MTRFSRTLGLAGAGCLALALQAATGCGGADFTGPAGASAGEGGDDDGSSTGGSRATGGSAAAGGSAAGGSLPQGGEAGGPSPTGGIIAGCHGPEDCSDNDPCTLDVCRQDGVCVLSSKCGSNELCCDGDCGACCDDQDCDDDVSCTIDACFAGTCLHEPSAQACAAGEYCSVQGGCVPQEPCSGADAGPCDDDDACTSDSCEQSKCVHGFCAIGTRCCPDSGCADECCSDQECDTDDDPCTVGVCAAGKCAQAPRCADGEKCCAGPEGASCGSCCSAAECGDEVDCTVDACVEGRCFNPPGHCADGYSCNPSLGCQKDIECRQDQDCTSQGCGQCQSGSCVYGCPANQLCCGNTCQECCASSDCFDGIDCTDNNCAGGTCEFKPNNKNCPLLQQCLVARRGCALL